MFPIKKKTIKKITLRDTGWGEKQVKNIDVSLSQTKCCFVIWAFLEARTIEAILLRICSRMFVLLSNIVLNEMSQAKYCYKFYFLITIASWLCTKNCGLYTLIWFMHFQFLICTILGLSKLVATYTTSFLTTKCCRVWQ